MSTAKSIAPTVADSCWQTSAGQTGTSTKKEARPANAGILARRFLDWGRLSSMFTVILAAGSDGSQKLSVRHSAFVKEVVPHVACIVDERRWCRESI